MKQDRSNVEGSSLYIPGDANVLRTIFKKHFPEFVDNYEEKYAPEYGKFRIGRIIEVAENFIDCGDYNRGIARIKCTNPECGHEYFRPFSCKSFYICLSCSQKRTLILSEYLTNKNYSVIENR